MVRSDRNGTANRRIAYFISIESRATTIRSQAEKATVPKSMETAPKEMERTVLLFCPEQDGWQTGRW